MAKITDKTVKSKYPPKQTNVTWIDTSQKPAVTKSYIDGQWVVVGGGVTDYNDIKNKPTINGVELDGNKTSQDLGVYSKPSTGIPQSDLSSDVQSQLNKHFKGWYNTLAELKAAHTATDGDSAYVKDASPATTWSIYVYDSTASSDNYWVDSGTDADTSNVQTFASSQEVNEVHIVNDLTTGGTEDVLSAEQGKKIADTTMELVEGLNILDPNTIIVGKRISPTGDSVSRSYYTYFYGHTDYIEIGEGVICNHSVKRSGTVSRGGAVYDSAKLFIGYFGSISNGTLAYVNEDINLYGTAAEGADTTDRHYVRFNLYDPTSVDGGVAYDGVTDGYAVYKGTTLPSSFQPWFEPYWDQKEANIKDNAITTQKIADDAVTIDKMADTEVNPITDNICNPEECTFDGHYIYGTSGDVSSSTSSGYAGYTGYIPIDERGVYCNGSKVSGTVIGYAYYSDENTQSYIDGFYQGHHPEGCTQNYAAYITGAKYVRFSIAADYSAETIMANIGNKEKPYVAYGGFKKTISKEILPNDEVNIDNILQQEKIYTDALKVALPDKFYAVRGDILQLFHKGVVYAIDFANRYAMPTCSKGTQYRRYYELNTTKVVFVVSSSASVSVGDVYSTQGNTYEVTKVATEGSTKSVTCTFKGSATITSSGTLTKISGNGDATISYTKFTDTVAAGEYPYTLTIYDDNRNILGEGSSVIKLVNFPTAPITTKNILCIGASTTAGGQWVCEAQRRLLGSGVNPTYENSPKGDGLDSSKIKFIGSLSKTLYGQTSSFFAKSGWSWEDFATSGRYAIRFYLEGSNRVTIGNKYTNNGHTYEVIELNTIDGVETIRCFTASGNTPNPHGDNVNGTLTLSSGDGDATLTYIKSEVDGANPFWNSTLEIPALDFQNYVETICGESGLDMMIIVLGANAMFSTSLEQQEEYVRTFVNACHADYPNCKIIIVGSSSPSMINMMPGYGVGGSSFGNIYLVKCRLLDIFKMYKTIAADYEYVEYESWAGQFDSDYNFPLTQKDVNIRNNTVQEPYANNTIHPGNAGYMQFADAAYRSIVAHLCQ